MIHGLGKTIDKLFKGTKQAGLSVSRNATCWLVAAEQTGATDRQVQH